MDLLTAIVIKLLFGLSVALVASVSMQEHLARKLLYEAYKYRKDRYLDTDATWLYASGLLGANV